MFHYKEEIILFNQKQSSKSGLLYGELCLYKLCTVKLVNVTKKNMYCI